MAAVRVRDATWENDILLKQKLEDYIRNGLQRKEILDYMTRDFNHYTWSLRTLDRRLRFFNIFRHDKNVTIDAVKNAVRK